LYDEFINFGKRHRCPLYQYGAVNEKVAEYFKNVLDKLGVDAKDSGAKICIGRER
jgi:ribosomal protein L22